MLIIRVLIGKKEKLWRRLRLLISLLRQAQKGLLEQNPPPGKPSLSLAEATLITQTQGTRSGVNVTG